MKEANFFGVFLSPFLVWGLEAFLILTVVRFIMDRTGLVRYVWHRSLFDISLFLVIMVLLVSFARVLSS